MKFVTKLTMLLAVLVLMAMPLFAADTAPTANDKPCPPMGPPAEMKMLAPLEGTWDVESKFNMSEDPSKPQWLDSKATATYKYIVGGAAMQCVYEGTGMMPGVPPMKGFMLQTYDRETKQWQASWIDNMSARISIYTGTYEKGTTILQGEDKFMGKTMLTRITISNETATSFDWKMESSIDAGKTWFTTGTAVYKKKA